MKFAPDKKLLKYLIYISVTIISLYITFLMLSNIGNILKTTSNIVIYILSMLKPFFIGIIIAYLLYPITRFIERFLLDNKIIKIKSQSNRRILGILFSYLSVIAIFIGLLCGIYFMIGGQLSNNTTITFIISEIKNYFSETHFSVESIQTTIDSLDSPLINELKPYILDIAALVQKYLTNNFSNITTSIISFGSNVATFFIALIISIYLLKDSEYFLSLWSKLYFLIFRESSIGKSVANTFSIIHVVFGKFIRGQLLEAFFVGILSAIALFIANIQYGFVIGIIAGICNMIPYVGPIVGTVLAAIMGLLSGSPIKILYAIVAMLIVQQIDNHFLAPNIVGNSVGLHPVFTMMAILIGANVGGVLGMLIAVPIAASFKVLFSNWYNSNINYNK